jgi:hypothetical protein
VVEVAAVNAPPLIDPRLLSNLGPFFPLLAEVQQLPTVDVQNADFEALRDQFDDTNWSTVTGLVGIPCRVTPYISRRGNETRANYTVFDDRNCYIFLAGWFPEIRTKMRIVVTEPKRGLKDTYDIRSVGTDSQNITTKLYGEIIA